jgi:hypothetical protein
MSWPIFHRLFTNSEVTAGPGHHGRRRARTSQHAWPAARLLARRRRAGAATLERMAPDAGAGEREEFATRHAREFLSLGVARLPRRCAGPGSLGPARPRVSPLTYDRARRRSPCEGDTPSRSRGRTTTKKRRRSVANCAVVAPRLPVPPFVRWGGLLFVRPKLVDAKLTSSIILHVSVSFGTWWPWDTEM